MAFVAGARTAFAAFVRGCAVTVDLAGLFVFAAAFGVRATLAFDAVDRAADVTLARFVAPLDGVAFLRVLAPASLEDGLTGAGRVTFFTDLAGVAFFTWA